MDNNLMHHNMANLYNSASCIYDTANQLIHARHQHEQINGMQWSVFGSLQ